MHWTNIAMSKCYEGKSPIGQTSSNANGLWANVIMGKRPIANVPQPYFTSHISARGKTRTIILFQIQNEKLARQYIKDMLYNRKYEAEMAELNKTRKSQIGNMDRNEKIRSYNYNRNAISEHRLGESKTVPDIGGFLQGAYGYSILSEWHEKLEDIELFDALKQL